MTCNYTVYTTTGHKLHATSNIKKLHLIIVYILPTIPRPKEGSKERPSFIYIRLPIDPFFNTDSPSIYKERYIQYFNVVDIGNKIRLYVQEDLTSYTSNTIPSGTTTQDT